MEMNNDFTYPEQYSQKQIDAINKLIDLHASMVMRYYCQGSAVDVKAAEREINFFYEKFHGDTACFVKELSKVLNEFVRELSTSDIPVQSAEEISRIYASVKEFLFCRINGNSQGIMDNDFWVESLDEARRLYANLHGEALNYLIIAVLFFLESKDLIAREKGLIGYYPVLSNRIS